MTIKTDSSTYCRDMVQEQDYDRYLTLMSAPQGVKHALYAVLAFNQEVAKTRESVSEVTMGAIRLQWWREALDSIEAATPRSHPVIGALYVANRQVPLPFDILRSIIDAREADIYDSAPENLTDLITYARDTAGKLNRVTLMLLDKTADEIHMKAAEDIGTAWGLLGIVRAIAFQASAQRHMMPDDLLKDYGITPDSLYRGEFTDDVFKVVAAITDEAEKLLNALGAKALSVKGNRIAAFTLARMARRVIKNLKRVNYNITKLDPMSGRLLKFTDVLLASLSSKL